VQPSTLGLILGKDGVVDLAGFRELSLGLEPHSEERWTREEFSKRFWRRARHIYATCEARR